MAQRKVRLVHDKSGGEYDAPESAVPFWTARGWRVPDERRRTAAQEEQPPAQEDKPAAKPDKAAAKPAEKGGK